MTRIRGIIVMGGRDALEVHQSWDDDKQCWSTTRFDCAYGEGCFIADWGSGRNYLFHNQPRAKAAVLIKRYLRELRQYDKSRESNVDEVLNALRGDGLR